MNTAGYGVVDSGYGAATYLDSAILCKLIELPKGEAVRKRHPSDQYVMSDTRIIEMLGARDAAAAAFLSSDKRRALSVKDLR